MTERDVLDRLMDDVPVGHAPVDHLLAQGRAAKRRKRRALVGGAAAATALVLGGGVLATNAVVGGSSGPRDPDAPVVADAPASDLTVRVEVGVAKTFSAVLGEQPGRRAAWDAEERTVTFVPDMGYSSSCPPVATAELTASGAVALTVRDDPGSGICISDARHVTVTIDGLTTAPSELTVSASGKTDTVPVVPMDPTTSNANERLAVGESGPLNVFVHCGLRYAQIDGSTWETAPRGGASAPQRWPDSVSGTATRIDEDTVVFTSAYVERWIVFRPVEQNDDFVCY